MNLPRTILNHTKDACQIYPETVYYAKRINRGVPFKKQPVYKKVLPDGSPEELNIRPSQKLANHSSEFNWNYGGSGPAQLALALLLDATTDPETAQAFYQDFKWDKVGAWGEMWSITRKEILNWLELQKKQQLQASFSKN